MDYNQALFLFSVSKYPVAISIWETAANIKKSDKIANLAFLKADRKKYDTISEILVLFKTYQ